LTFLTPRFDSELLPLNTSGITKKKERDVHKMQAVIHYAEHEYQCRTLLLLNYFNEKDGSPCGICDNCVRRKKEKPEDVDSGLGNEIMVYLQKDGPVTPRLLAGTFDQIPEKKLLEVVRFLIEEERIGYDESGRLQSF
jgi:ATP-dependent DNA helicase RecQ